MTISFPYNSSVYIAFIIKMTLTLNSSPLVAANKTRHWDKTGAGLIPQMMGSYLTKIKGDSKYD